MVQASLRVSQTSCASVYQTLLSDPFSFHPPNCTCWRSSSSVLLLPVPRGRDSPQLLILQVFTILFAVRGQVWSLGKGHGVLTPAASSALLPENSYPGLQGCAPYYIRMPRLLLCPLNVSVISRLSIWDLAVSQEILSEQQNI